MPNTLLTTEVIAGEALDVLRNNAVMPNLVYRDYSNDFVPGVGSKITIRKPAVFEAKTFGAEIELQDATETQADVVMDTLLDVSFSVTSKEMTQNVTDFSGQFIEPAMQAFLDKIDSALIRAAVDGAGKVATVGSVDQDAIVDARQALVTAKAPLTDRNFVFGAYTEADMLKTQLFVHADQVGDNGAALREAALGRKFGLDCYTDQNCTGASEDDGVIFHKNALGLVTRPLELPQGAGSASVANYDGFGIRVVYGYDIKSKTNIVSLDMLFGTAVLYGDLISVIKRTVAAAG